MVNGAMVNGAMVNGPRALRRRSVEMPEARRMGQWLATLGVDAPRTTRRTVLRGASGEPVRSATRSG